MQLNHINQMRKFLERSILFLELGEFINNFASVGCIINGGFWRLDDIEKMECDEYALRSKISTPVKLYKYFNNREISMGDGVKNYSLDALKNNTVHMSLTTDFDDVYDSEIIVDFRDYEHSALLYYCELCQISCENCETTEVLGNKLVQKLYEVACSNKSFEPVYCQLKERTLDRLNLEHFCLQVRLKLNHNKDFGNVIAEVIFADYREYTKELKTKFRVACFTTTPYSQLMWGAAYADEHKGFCIEYTIDSNDKTLHDVYCNLYPLIYSKRRSKFSAKLIYENFKDVSKEVLWGIYFHGALRKSVDWVFQNEWRLLLPQGWGKEHNYNIPFFPITKVFLGNRMTPMKRKEIIELCNQKRIPYTGMTTCRETFDMKECPVLCENCQQYQQNLKNETEKRSN